MKSIPHYTKVYVCFRSGVSTYFRSYSLFNQLNLRTILIHSCDTCLPLPAPHHPRLEAWRVFVCMIPFERAQLATFQCPSFSRLPIARLCVQAILINSCLQHGNLTQQMFKRQHTCNLIWDIFLITAYVRQTFQFHTTWIWLCLQMRCHVWDPEHSFIIKFRV